MPLCMTVNVITPGEEVAVVVTYQDGQSWSGRLHKVARR